jgi:hypothetical protein
MPPILELMKKNAVPVGVMRTAAKGALPLPPSEMLEVLVYLTQNPDFAQDARNTLARWEMQSAIEILFKSTAPPEVLSYFWMEENRRPGLLPALIENPAIPEGLVMELAGTASRDVVNVLLASRRVRSSPALVEALSTNEYLTPVEARELQSALATAGASAAAVMVETPVEAIESSPEVEAAHQIFQKENAVEIAAEEGKPFELTGTDDEPAADATASPTAATEVSVAPVAPPPEPVEEERLTILQRISKMNVGQRIKAAFSGNKEERAILIRDSVRLVQNAVLASPKLSDAEVETFAGAKNLGENVMREIARQRRFIKVYSVIRNLVNNPRCPLDISLTLVKNLQVYDLKSLRHSKGVPDTIRKVAERLYQEKASRGGKRD